jgi:hypothetical protein
MEIRIRNTGEVISDTAFRLSHDNVAFPAVLSKDVLDAFEADAVLAAPSPTVSSTQKTSRDGVVQDTLGNWVYKWKIEDKSAEELEEERVASVPLKVTRRQARQALFLAGVTSANVETAINTLPSPHKELAMIEWEDSLEFERSRALVVSMGPLLGLTALQLDNLFIAAAKL